MIGYEQAWAVCRTDPATAAQMLCEWSRELDRLQAEFTTLKAENAALRRDGQSLRDKVQALEQKAAQDSHNSSKPPSSDGLAKPKPKSLRPPSQRPTGGQPGHPGQTLRRVEKPDRTVRHPVATARAAGLASLPNTDRDHFLNRYQHIVATGYAQNPITEAPAAPKRRGRRKQSKARNLLDRFRDHPEGILAFMRDFSVPFDNNLSEQDLRMMKLRQKISGTFRSFEALVNFCRIRGYVSTARKNGLNALDALRRVFLGDPFTPTLNTS